MSTIARQSCRRIDRQAINEPVNSAMRRASLNASNLPLACSKCSLREICIPVGLSPADTDLLDTAIGGRHRVKVRDHLYCVGQSFSSIYAVKSGFFKTSVLTEDGREHVTGFQMAGEILGMDGITSDVHSCTAVALEDSEVCWIPFVDLEHLSRKVDTLQHHFHKVMSREIVRDYGVLMLLGKMRADERLATFLLNLSQRFGARGYSTKEFHLRMTREEIGSYLGMTLETVSRGFSKMHEDRVIMVDQKRIRILDFGRLKRLMLNVA